MWVLSEPEAQTLEERPSTDAEPSPGSVVAFALPERPLPPGVLEAVREVFAASRVSSQRAVEVMETLAGDLGSSVDDGMLLQARLTATRLRAIGTEFGLLTSDQVARRVGSTARNSSATPTRWARAGKVFTVETADKRLYPAFQFDPATGRPLPVIEDVLAILGPATGTTAALWFTAPNAYLEDARPVDRLADNPAAVVDAATRFKTPSI
jgi:hypothetical protein